MALSFEYGLYVPGDSIIHRLDPRAKIIWVLLVLSFSVLNGNYLYNPLYGALIYSSLVLSLAYCRPGAFWLRLATGLSLVIGFFNMVFWPASVEPRGRVLLVVPLLGWEYTEFAFNLAASKVFLVINPVIAMMILIVTTKPGDLLQALVKWRTPYKIAYIPVLALRFLPTVITEARTIIDAQKSRALDFEKGGLFVRVRKYVAVFVPLMIRMMRSTIELGVALDSKGFGAGGKRTFSNPIRFGARDVLFLAGVCLIYGGPAAYLVGVTI